VGRSPSLHLSEGAPSLTHHLPFGGVRLFLSPGCALSEALRACAAQDRRLEEPRLPTGRYRSTALGTRELLTGGVQLRLGAPAQGVGRRLRRMSGLARRRVDRGLRSLHNIGRIWDCRLIRREGAAAGRA
jgi:hypothetical protein